MTGYSVPCTNNLRNANPKGNIMSKTKTSDTVTKTEAVTVGKFTFDMGLPVPTVTRNSANPSEIMAKLAAVPLGASFLEPVAVPENTAEAERDNVFKEKARSMSNRLSGAVRRFKEKHPGVDFQIRTVNDDTLGHGVRVYRVEPKPVAEAATGAAGEAA